jgi:hypothetical protein
VTAKPWAEVTVDGKPVGKTPVASRPLSAGEHVIVLTHPDYEPLRRVIEIQSGVKRALHIDLRDESLLKRKK